MSTKLDELKAKVINKAVATPNPNSRVTVVPVAPTAPAAPAESVAPPAEFKKEEKIYQTYRSSLASQRIAMPNGKLITVTANQYITDDEAEIEFLDKEIKGGFPYMSKTGQITSEELDPMAVLRKKIIAEYLAEQKAGLAAATAAVPSPTLGNSSTDKVVPASTSDLGALAGASNSVASE